MNSTVMAASFVSDTMCLADCGHHKYCTRHAVQLDVPLRPCYPPPCSLLDGYKQTNSRVVEVCGGQPYVGQGDWVMQHTTPTPFHATPQTRQTARASLKHNGTLTEDIARLWQPLLNTNTACRSPDR